MLLIALPASIVERDSIRLDKFSSAMFLVLMPISFVDWPVMVFESSNPLQVATTKASFIGADTHKRHYTLAIKLSICEISFESISVFEDENSFSPLDIMSPLALVNITIKVLHSSWTVPQSVTEMAFIPVPRTGNEYSKAMHFISFPLAIVVRAIWE